MFRIATVGLFPELVEPVVSVGVVGRARERGLIEWAQYSPREYTHDRHRTVDDRPYGGGPGMVMRYEPVRDAVRAADEWLPAGAPRFLLSAQGRVLDQAMAGEIAAGPGVLLVAGRYEGLDERIALGLGLTELSVGDYVLSGGEPAAAVVIDAVTRLLPGVVGHEESTAEDSFSRALLDCPHYTRPETVDGLEVPAVLLSGDHDAVRRWRLKQALGRTWLRRPDVLEKHRLTDEEADLLAEFQAEQRDYGAG